MNAATDPTINHPPLSVTRLARWLMEPTVLGDGVSPANSPAIELAKQLALAVVLRHGSEEHVMEFGGDVRSWHMGMPDKGLRVWAVAMAPAEEAELPIRHVLKLFIHDKSEPSSILHLWMGRSYAPGGKEITCQFFATDGLHPKAGEISARLWYGEGSAALRKQAAQLRTALCI